MKVTNMKKVLLAIGLGFGISGALSGVANAFPDYESCLLLKAQCESGNSNSCGSYNTYKCFVVTGPLNN
ncbi:MAG: hypothetical protein ACI8WB_003788 [Phenylobacterium sp.]|jgi:hypothetical protein